MENYFISVIEKSKRAIKNWWLFTLLGAIICLMGILILVHPVTSYLGISLVFGLIIMLTGLSVVILSLSNEHYVTSRAWMLVGGVVEMMLGIVLCLNPAFTAGMLPYFLGFWLLFRSFSMLGLGFDMRQVKIKGWGSTVFFGLLTALASLIILFQPLQVGSQAVILWVALSFMFAGVSLIMFSVKLKDFHRAYR